MRKTYKTCLNVQRFQNFARRIHATDNVNIVGLFLILKRNILSELDNVNNLYPFIVSIRASE